MEWKKRLKLESDPQASCPIKPGFRGPYPTAAKAREGRPAAAPPGYGPGEYVPPTERYVNIDFMSRATKLNEKFTAATVAEAIAEARG